ncbi:MAG: sporulation protein YabP [Clostridia bacterium]|nr:sporulation protein YabP [Clostridia bacterium]
MERKETEIGRMRARAHSIHIDNRMRTSITGVMDVLSFNEQEVMLMTEAGGLNIVGSGMHLSRLNLEDGQICIEGELMALDYEAEEGERRGLFGKVFR